MSVTTSKSGRGTAWNSGKLIGPKPPLQAKHVWAIRTHLQLAEKPRDLALFNLAIDSKLRGCDVVAVKVADIAPHGYALDRATVRQRKTGRPVKFELTEQTREAINAHIRASGNAAGTTCSTGVGTANGICPRASTPGLYPTGSRSLASTPRSSALTRCDGRRRR